MGSPRFVIMTLFFRDLTSFKTERHVALNLDTDNESMFILTNDYGQVTMVILTIFFISVNYKSNKYVGVNEAGCAVGVSLIALLFQPFLEDLEGFLEQAAD